MREKLEKGIDYLIKINKNKEKSLLNARPIIGFLIGIRYKDARLKDKDYIVNHIKISIRIFLESLCTKANKSDLCFIIIFNAVRDHNLISIISCCRVYIFIFTI